MAGFERRIQSAKMLRAKAHKYNYDMNILPDSNSGASRKCERWSFYISRCSHFLQFQQSRFGPRTYIQKKLIIYSLNIFISPALQHLAKPHLKQV